MRPRPCLCQSSTPCGVGRRTHPGLSSFSTAAAPGTLISGRTSWSKGSRFTTRLSPGGLTLHYQVVAWNDYPGVCRHHGDVVWKTADLWIRMGDTHGPPKAWCDKWELLGYFSVVLRRCWARKTAWTLHRCLVDGRHLHLLHPQLARRARGGSVCRRTPLRQAHLPRHTATRKLVARDATTFKFETPPVRIYKCT